MPKNFSAFGESDPLVPLFYDYEVDEPWLIRPGRRPQTVPGFGGISSDKWGHMLRQAKRRVIAVCLTARDAWGIYLSQGGCCALTGEPIWFSPDDRLGGANWLAGVLRRVKDHPEAFDPDCVSLQEKANRVTASLDRIDSKQGYTLWNVQWVHKRLQEMKMALTEDDFIYWCRRIARYRKKDGLGL